MNTYIILYKATKSPYFRKRTYNANSSDDAKEMLEKEDKEVSFILSVTKIYTKKK